MGELAGPNPNRIGACACGSYRADGRFPYLHNPGCHHDGDLQIDRWLAEEQAGDHGGRPLTKHDTEAS